jgi:hypothetical protein
MLAGLEAMRATLEGFEESLHAFTRNAFAVRILERFGWTRILRLAVAAWWLISVLFAGLLVRPDLIHPSEIGSDSSNYIGASERLAAGHHIYDLAPGDRPVPMDNPPEWSVPLLSPPTVPVATLWTVALPDAVRLYPMWALGLAGTIATGFLVAALAPPLLLIVATARFGGLAVTAWSGNVNAMIVAAIVVIWWGGRSERRAPQVLAGVLVALAAAVKIGPAMLAIWILSQGRRPAIAAMLATGAVVAAATVLVAGPDAIRRWLEVARESAGVATSLSLPGRLMELGVPSATAAFAIPFAMALAVVGIVLLRREPVAFLIAVLASVFATTVVREETLAVAIAGMVAWWGRGLLVRARQSLPDGIETAMVRSSERPAVNLSVSGAALVTLIMLGRSIATGGLMHSSFVATNAGSDPVIVRIKVSDQAASFGYLVRPHGSITGWRMLGAGSPPAAVAWTMDCEQIGYVLLPQSGGAVEIDAGAVRLTADDPAAADPRVAPFADDVATCAPEMRLVQAVPAP